jgi:hypothetical protein
MGTGKRRSTNINDKPKLVERLARVSPQIRELFADLETKLKTSTGCTNYGYTDRPDFRIACDEVLVALEPYAGGVRVRLRVDNDNPSPAASLPFEVKPFPTDKTGWPGKLWIGFEITSRTQLSAAVSLIDAVYKRRVALGGFRRRA